MTINKVVIGLGFGDEGKGLFTNYLCLKSPKPLVIRFSGGQQVGHTVVNNNGTDEIRHVFSNFGSGTLNNVPTYWSKFCTISPSHLLCELSALKKNKVEPILYIDERCPVTTPYDIEFNKKNEEKNRHGSTGLGFGSTIEREENFYSLTFNDLFYSDIFKERLNLIKKYYENKGITITENEYNCFYKDCYEIMISAIICKNFIKIFDIPKGFKTHIYEGSQGLLLDQHFGFFPHVTRANLGLKNVLELSNKKNMELFLITRAYQTRHGNGFMTHEDVVNNIDDSFYETNKYNLYQGKFRKSLLDVSLLKYAINKDENIKKCKNKNLVITCLNQIENEYSFFCENTIVYSKDEKEFVKKIGNILGIKKIYISKSSDSRFISKK